MLIESLKSTHADACVAVVATLPEWFGYEGALDDVGCAARTQAGFVAVEGEDVFGFVTTNSVFEETVEITYLAVRKGARRQGVGRALVVAVCAAARQERAETITLLTLGPSSANSHYAETVEFYRAIGFGRTKELFLTAWGGAPTLVMSSPIDRLLRDEPRS